MSYKLDAEQRKRANALVEQIINDSEAAAFELIWLRVETMKETKNENGSVDLFCECVNWCRDGCDMLSPHHPRYEHYQSPPDDPRYAIFGKLMWEMIEQIGGEFCGDEWSEYVLPLAEKAGLCRRVIYDPAIHGNVVDAEPGCEIWYWGDTA